MTELRYTRRALAWCMTGAIALLSGCATTGTSSPQEQVEQRAQQRWDLVLDDDLNAAYAYFTPGYRSGMSSNAWQRTMLARRVAVTAAEVTGSECDEDTCEVSVLAGYSVHGAVPGVDRYDGETTVTEDWLRVDGQWFYLPED